MDSLWSKYVCSVHDCCFSFENYYANGKKQYKAAYEGDGTCLDCADAKFEFGGERHTPLDPNLTRYEYKDFLTYYGSSKVAHKIWLQSVKASGWVYWSWSSSRACVFAVLHTPAELNVRVIVAFDLRKHNGIAVNRCWRSKIRCISNFSHPNKNVYIYIYMCTYMYIYIYTWMWWFRH